MMKKTVKSSAIIIILCISAISISQNTQKSADQNYSLMNLRAMKANAGEMWCDQTNEKECKIVYGDATGYSTGVLRATQ